MIVSQTEAGTVAADTSICGVRTDARCAVVLARNDRVGEVVLVGGRFLEAGDMSIFECPGMYSGKVVGADSDAGDSWFVLEEAVPSGAALTGSTVFVVGEEGRRRAYPVRDVRTVNGQTRLYTKVGHAGFEAVPAASWDLPLTVHLRNARPE